MRRNRRQTDTNMHEGLGASWIYISLIIARDQKEDDRILFHFTAEYGATISTLDYYAPTYST